MKPGDLVKLIQDGLGDVCVASIDDSGIWGVDHNTVAVFLNEHHWLNERGHEKKKIRILVKGRIGWIYESECEVIDETG